MHKLIHKLIHYREGGVNIVADINAAIATGESGASSSSVHTYSRIVQRNRRKTTESEARQENQKEVKDDETDA